MPEHFIERNLLPPQKDRSFPVYNSVSRFIDNKTQKKERLSFEKLQNEIFKESYPYVKEKELKNHLTGFGLEPDQMIGAWEESHWKLKEGSRVARKELAGIYAKNFAVICRLELQKPGGAKVLHDDFGIKTFGRYPTEMLLEQYNNKDNAQKPYGLAVFARGDHNGVFYENNLNYLRNTSYTVRIIEAEGKTDYVDKVLSIHDRYKGSEGRKISFEIDFGHGLPDRIRFRDQVRDSVLSKNHLKDEELVWRLKSCYEEDAVKILASCYTGVKGGLASHMAEQLDMTVVGPDDAAGCPIIRPRRRMDGGLHFNVFYPKADISKGQPQPKRYDPPREIFTNKAS